MNVRAGIVAVWCLVGLYANATAAPPSAPSTSPKKTGSAGIRTIDAINIEGEIAVPQVLFITSRDTRRYRDGLGKNFRTGTLDVTRSIVMPNRLCVAGESGSEPFKEE